MSAEFEKELGTQSFDDIVDSTLEAIIQRDVGLSNINPGSVIRTLIEAIAENEDTANYYMEFIYRIMDIDNCEGEELDRAVKILGLIRNTAKPAVATVTMYSGDAPAQYDVEIPYGFIVSTRPNYKGEVIEFMVTDNEAVLKAGETSVDVTVTCTEAGFVHVPVGAISILSSSLQGIHEVRNESAIDGGRDSENDEDFRERIANVRETFGKCTDEAIESAVDSINGVTKSRVVDRYNGIGTVGIVVVTDTVPAPASVISEIEAVVQATKASGIAPFIIYTDVKGVDIDINIVGKTLTEDDKNTIIDVISKYCDSLNAGQEFIIKQMERKVLNALDSTLTDNDEIDIETIKPTDNITATSEQIIRCDVISINGEIMVDGR